MPTLNQLKISARAVVYVTLAILRSFLCMAIIFLFVNSNCKRTQFKPFDVVANPEKSPGFDDNGYLINPLWGQQILSGINSLPDITACGPTGSAQDNVNNWVPCTDNALDTERGKGCGPHVNFLPVHYNCKIFWHDKTDAGQDDDYNLTLFDPGKSLFSVQSPGAILGEFDSDETIDHFHTRFWDDFHNAVDDDEDLARRMIDQRDAIVIGLLGLDCAHGHNCHVELHPIYILAIDAVNEDASDRWAFFARNSGNEGWCSSNDKHLASGPNGTFEYTITIPNTTASSFSLSKADVRIFKNGSSTSAGNSFKHSFIPGKGLKLTFVLTDPEKLDDDNDLVIEGDISIIWN